MTKTRACWASLLLCLIVTDNCLILAASQGKTTVKPIKVMVRVEAEGPEGLQVQDAKDLSPTELTQLQSAIRAEIAKLKDHVLVDPNEPSDAIGVVVVAAKYSNPSGQGLVLSSVITIAKADGTDAFVSHDVIATKGIPAAAKAVAFYLVSVEFRFLVGATR